MGSKIYDKTTLLFGKEIIFMIGNCKLKPLNPCGSVNIKCVAKEDGIHFEYDEMDKNGNITNSFTELVLPKEVFMAAYNAYVKNANNKQTGN